MKVIRFVFLAFCLTGCASSKHSTDPRAAVVGPAYLDYIAAHPRDQATQYYYPSFGIHNFQPSEALLTPLPKSAAGPKVAALLADIPEPSRQVQEVTGKGYPCLERTGIRLFTAPSQQKLNDTP